MYHTDFFNPLIGKPVRSCLDRFIMIKPFVRENSLLIDLGCSEGYFSFSFAYHCDVLGVDREEELIEQNKKTAKEHGISVTFEQADIAEFELREADTILYMSTHHHVIQKYDWEKANSILKNISEHCKQLFFDMGQWTEGCVEYEWWKKLPEPEDQEQWVKDYLLGNSAHTSAQCLGETIVHGVPRYLFRSWKNGTAN